MRGLDLRFGLAPLNDQAMNFKTRSAMRLLLATCLLLICGCAVTTVDRPPAPAGSLEKRIALSFDDGPRGAGPRFSGDERAEALIGALAKSSGQPAVFYIKTANLKRKGGVARIKRYAQAGHLIANHTHSHHWLSQTDTQEYVEDIDRAERLLSTFTNRRRWFRFPYLDEGRTLQKRNDVRAALEARALFNGYVTVDNYDWYIERKWQDAVDAGKSVNMEALKQVYVDMLVSAVEFYDSVAVEALGRSPAHVLLLHENDVGALFVDDLVYALKNKGWQIVSPDAAYADPVASVVPTTLRTRQGHIAALAIEAGRDPRTLTHWAIEEKQIDQVLFKRRVFGD